MEWFALLILWAVTAALVVRALIWRPRGAEDRMIPDAAPAEGFSRRALLNASEMRLHAAIGCYIETARPDLHLSCQVCLGEFLSHPDWQQYRRINTKRADFVLFDGTGRVHAVVEFDGAGHWGNSERSRKAAIDRDQLKNAALSSAGIPVLRITPSYSNAQIRAALDSTLPQERARATVPRATTVSTAT